MLKQVITFNELENGLCSFSDIDAITEYNNQYMIAVEVKKIGNNIPIGQNILLERTIDAWVRENHTYDNTQILLDMLSKHQTIDFKWIKPAPKKDGYVYKVIHTTLVKDFIPLKDCIVESYYHKGKWYEMEEFKTFKEVYEEQLTEWGLKIN